MRPTVHEIAVIEPQRRWVSELRRQFAAESVRIRHCADGSSAVNLLRDGHPRILVCVLYDPARCLALLEKLQRRELPVSTIVISSPDLSELELPIRELGATMFLIEPLDGHELAAACRRQWREERQEAR